jgi:siroheme synthase
VELASAGLRVVRLKGGDPLLFGHGAEEARALEASGIPFEFIPGVGALQGAACASGIPLTHRGAAAEVRILEGHHLLERCRDWDGLARGGATLALFMATRTLPAIARRLLEHGAAPGLPAALVERACCRDQAVSLSDLASAAGGLLRPRTGGPGLVLLGPALQARVHPIEAPKAGAHACPGAPTPP